ncbi:MAG: hypothetical protein AAGC73_05420 [Verrucomicrobiota bacterium]
MEPKSQKCPEGLLTTHDYWANKRFRGFRKFRKQCTKPLVRLGCKVIPAVYKLWMCFVFATSKVEQRGGLDIPATVEANPKMVVALWHQDVFSAPHLFKCLGVHTLANTSDLGHLITAVLEKHQFKVFRGGRKRCIILRDMIRYMTEQERVVYGLTVDGSRGPARKMKRGACTIARECQVPIFLVSSQARYQLRCATWDRLLVFLPFNRIETRMIGPFMIDTDCSEEAFAERCNELEARLNQLEDEVKASVG